MLSPMRGKVALADGEIAPATGFRWTICALIFFATTVNYLDRQIFSILVPFFENELKLGPTDLALINVSFILPYGLSMMFIGRLIDKVGIKKGLGGAFMVWNVACVAHAAVKSLTGFIGARFLLGVGEAGMFPAAIKTMTEWFPKRERALATGYFNAGANMGAIFAPLVGVALATQFGWRACFVVVGLLGLGWLVFWQLMYQPMLSHPKVSDSERAFIDSDNEPAIAPPTYAELLSIKPMYGLIIAKALSDAPWWFYLTWMPKFLIDQFKLSPGFMALAIPVIYIVADGGSIAGGWLSSSLIQRGNSVTVSRKFALLTCAIAVLPVMSVGWLVDVPTVLGIPSVYWAVSIVALAAAAHQGWSANLFTVISDTVPKSSVAMAVGIINGFGMVGVSAMQFFVGRSVQLTSSYIWPFVVAGSLYLIALGVLHVFLPEIKQRVPEKKLSIGLIAIPFLVILAGLGWLQYETNKPPYKDLSSYLELRAPQLKAQPGAKLGPKAKVGWMDAQWTSWTLENGKPKYELIKFDTAGRPIVESKGVGAKNYTGPKEADLARSF